MNGEQATKAVTLIMEPSQAAASAAQAVSNINDAGIARGKRIKPHHNHKPGDGAKSSRVRDHFEIDDFVPYTSLREQDLKLQRLSDFRGYVTKEIENLDVIRPVHNLEPHIQEVSSKQRAGLASNFCRATFQVGRTPANDCHGVAT